MNSEESVPRLGTHLLDRDVEVVDLTQPLYEGMPIFPLHQRPFIMVNQTHDQSVEWYGVRLPFETHNLLINEHTGTHADAIFEYDRSGPTIDQTPLAFYYGQAICLDVTATKYPEYFTANVLQKALDESGQEIRLGDTVLLYTGHAERTLPGREYLTNYAGLSRDGAEWLADRGVINIGVDAVSIDHSDDEDMAGHVVCKEYQIVNTESLTNLRRVAGSRFRFFGLPLYIREGTGSPIRAVAVMNRVV